MLLCCTGLWAQQGNPLMDVVGKPFAEYFPVYDSLYASLRDDPDSRAELSRLVDEAADADKTGEWKLLARISEHMVRYHVSRKAGYVPSADYTSEDFARDMLAASREAAQNDLRCLEFYSLYEVAQSYRLFEPQNYELAFEYFRQLEGGLENIATTQFSLKPYYYMVIGDFYYSFRDYAAAMERYGKILADPEDEGNIYQSSAYMHARNGLGLCYRYGYNDLERSDYYFEENMARSADDNNDVWKGISSGNLGINRKLAGDYEKAIPLLERSLEIMLLHGDHSFASGISLALGEIYFDRSDMGEARRYIELTDRYVSAQTSQSRIASLFTLKNKYYTATGRSREALMYLDSALVASQKYNDQYSGMILRRVEQRAHLIETRAMDEQLSFEKERSTFFRRNFTIATIGAVLLMALLAVTVYFYRKKRSAYRELVRRSQSWAGIGVAEAPETGDDEPQAGSEAYETFTGENTATAKPAEPEESDRVIMESVEKAMSEKKLYKRSELSLDMLAAETGLNRYYISTALNRCAGKNFSGYVNDYRIKEAIRILSDPQNNNLTLDGIAYEAGFNDRYNFHRVFKKKTGLSPSDFRKNMNGK